MNNVNNKKGATIIIMTILILGVILAATSAISNIVMNSILAGKLQIDATKAFFASEAGAERILWEVRKNSFDPVLSDCNNNDNVCFSSDTFGIVITGCGSPCLVNRDQRLDNDASFFLEYEFDGTDTTFTSVGGYAGDVTRIVEITY